jgi:folate-binding protein YgfZ
MDTEINLETQAPPAQPTMLTASAAGARVREFCGAQTSAVFGGFASELAALIAGRGVYDLGWLARLRITGADRVRWLNGMVTNTVKDLKPGQLNYTFLLNAQGRIQGDGMVYAASDALFFVTDREQMPKLAAHLDRFIIMDEVELAQDEEEAALGLCGPEAHSLLVRLGLADDEMPANSFVERARAQYGPVLTGRDDAGHFTLWTTTKTIGALWQHLTEAGAVACGVDAVEALRVLEGRPRYGVDIQEKSLAQETGQMRALNFNKGCYLGQEIVERVRSRATMHRGLQCFALEGPAPQPGVTLFAENAPDAAIATLTSIQEVNDPALPPALQGVFALGTVRTDAFASGAALHYEGGLARVLAKPPVTAAKLA